MKRILLCFILISVYLFTATAQITTPQIKAGFGVDADLRSNYFNGFIQSGNDDWFVNGTFGTGAFIIDTTGAAAILSKYSTQPASRKVPFFRNMRYDQFSVVNNKMLIDAIFIRDHHGDDSTVFASGSNKNGMNPSTWTTPISQGIPDKNDLLDAYMHVRRDGINSNDSLWMFGGVSIDNTTGNRYFDFEMYQTDIYYNRPTLSFRNFGPDAGHTSWAFDASGNITAAGDIIFTAEYGSSSLSLLEARIWVHQSALSITPATFNWGGQFDGASAGAVYGYASIVPKTAGAFYTGLQSVNNTWAGTFQVVLQNEVVTSTYSAKQFMEFSVNLSKLGIDPILTLHEPCAMPFRRILIKSRASTSFTAELKDFVGPFSFFRAPAADIATDFPVLCQNGVGRIWVTNPLSTSLYQWSTPNGLILGDSTGTEINVAAGGTYFVRQQLMDSCGTTYARDTIVVTMSFACDVLSGKPTDFNAKLNNQYVHLSWKSEERSPNVNFIIERSIDGKRFDAIKNLKTNSSGLYAETDDISSLNSNEVYYRLKFEGDGMKTTYSSVVRLYIPSVKSKLLGVYPNPVRDVVTVSVNLPYASPVKITITNSIGMIVYQKMMNSRIGVNEWVIHEAEKWSSGNYFIQVQYRNEVMHKQLMVSHK